MARRDGISVVLCAFSRDPGRQVEMNNPAMPHNRFNARNIFDQRRVIVTGRSERKGAILNVKSTKFYSIL